MSELLAVLLLAALASWAARLRYDSTRRWWAER